jgi:hypothetical protein
MATGHGSKKQIGAGAKGKSAGVGAMTDLPPGVLGDNQVLSNRDKKQHNDQRGLDSKSVQVEQYQDTEANQGIRDE